MFNISFLCQHFFTAPRERHNSAEFLLIIWMQVIIFLKEIKFAQINKNPLNNLG